MMLVNLVQNIYFLLFEILNSGITNMFLILKQSILLILLKLFINIIF